MRTKRRSSTPGMKNMTLHLFGAAQEIGRSCFLLKIFDKAILLDCGIDPKKGGKERYPDLLKYVADANMGKTEQKTITELIDFVLITHYHIDHSGAIPYLVEICGYSGPIYTTHPTLESIPILLNDNSKLDQLGKGQRFFHAKPKMLENSLKNVIGHGMEKMVISGVSVTPYNAGHVIGSVMYFVEYMGASVLYTGDYNMTPNWLLRPAALPMLCPDVLITESTYGTVVRSSKKIRDREFLLKVHEGVSGGGKVLIPVQALGRAQELCLLVDMYWERMRLGHIPVYADSWMRERGNKVFGRFREWTNVDTDTKELENLFEYKHIERFRAEYLQQPGPMVIFSSPGSLSGGTSLEIFKELAPHKENKVIIPGYCKNNLLDKKILEGGEQDLKVGNEKISVKLQVENLSFTSHTDKKGILQLVMQVNPASVVLVHGDLPKMVALRNTIKRAISVPVSMPQNNTCHLLDTRLEMMEGVLRKDGKPCLYSEQGYPWRKKCSGSSGVGKLIEEYETRLVAALRCVPAHKREGVRRVFVRECIGGYAMKQILKARMNIGTHGVARTTALLFPRKGRTIEEIIGEVVVLFYPERLVQRVAESEVAVDNGLSVLFEEKDDRIRASVKYTEANTRKMMSVLRHFKS
ncbi:MAG: Integrator complex subunit 11 [Amphiamblys sp. WSBS2006]|nr:MAG: Integrator complex subunit 11 [Amphiamblys sp. WSBS2006]